MWNYLTDDLDLSILNVCALVVGELMNVFYLANMGSLPFDNDPDYAQAFLLDNSQVPLEPILDLITGLNVAPNLTNQKGQITIGSNGSVSKGAPADGSLVSSSLGRANQDTQGANNSSTNKHPFTDVRSVSWFLMPLTFSAIREI